MVQPPRHDAYQATQVGACAVTAKSLSALFRSAGLLVSMCSSTPASTGEYCDLVHPYPDFSGLINTTSMDHISASWIGPRSGVRVWGNGTTMGAVLDPATVLVKCAFPGDASSVYRSAGCGKMFATWNHWTTEIALMALNVRPYKEDTASYSEAPVLSVEWADQHLHQLPAECEAVRQACTVPGDKDQMAGSFTLRSLMQWLRRLRPGQPAEWRSGCLTHTAGRFGRLFDDGTTLKEIVPPAKLVWGSGCAYLPEQWSSFINASALLAARSDELGFMWWNEVILETAAESQAIFIVEGAPLRHEAAAEARRRGLPLLLANSTRASSGADLFVCAEEDEEVTSEPYPAFTRAQALLPA